MPVVGSVRRFAAVAVPAAILGLAAAGAAEIPAHERRSGFEFMGRDSQAMQRDDSVNPAMLWVGDGEALWNEKVPPANRACADCHGGAAQSMRGVAARYPAFDEASGGPIDLQGRINQCRTMRQQAQPLPFESQPLLALTAYVASHSRTLPIAPPDDPRLAPSRARGRELFGRRAGQLDLSCADCHDDNWGKRLGGSIIPQGHATGYPLYRLEWQGVGSLQRRLRNCLIGIRAEPYPYGSPDYIALELFLAERALGLPVETPAVRP